MTSHPFASVDSAAHTEDPGSISDPDAAAAAAVAVFHLGKQAQDSQDDAWMLDLDTVDPV